MVIYLVINRATLSGRQLIFITDSMDQLPEPVSAGYQLNTSVKWLTFDTRQFRLVTRLLDDDAQIVLPEAFDWMIGVYARSYHGTAIVSNTLFEFITITIGGNC